MEEERERAVQAYRSLKKQKQQQHEARNAMNANLEKLKNLSWQRNYASVQKLRRIERYTQADWMCCVTVELVSHRSELNQDNVAYCQRKKHTFASTGHSVR